MNSDTLFIINIERTYFLCIEYVEACYEFVTKKTGFMLADELLSSQFS